MRVLKKIIPYFFPIIFFLISILTIYDYGMNWDSPQHFARGQAFLHFILTGKKDYSGLIRFCSNQDNINSSVDYLTGQVCDRHRPIRRSEYQSDGLDFAWAVKDTYGHPPFSDIMEAASNQIFFIWLGVVEDVQAYHLFSIFATFLLALFVAYWLKKTYGLFASVIGGLSIYLYPLLLGEQHFNIKDPPIASFFVIGIGLFYFAIVKKNYKLMLLSALFGGFSFATKINYIFAPFILLPWMMFILFDPIKKNLKKNNFFSKKFWFTLYKHTPKLLTLSIIFYPFIVFAIFFGTWPSFWFFPQKTVSNVIRFYTDVGVSTCAYSKFSLGWLFQCTSSYALQFFLYSTPIIILVLFITGFLVGIKQFRKFNFLPVLLISFFLVTLLRVTFSIAAIYGGIRQILEFIGPVAMLSGIGAVWIRDFTYTSLQKFFSKKQKKYLLAIVSIIIVFGFVPIIIKMLQMHPNENIYMNPLVGGVKGAVSKNISGAGNTYGNAYYQGVRWLNLHAKTNASIGLLAGLGQNISRASLRSDFSYQGGWPLSGYNQTGEYVISLVAQNNSFANTFEYKFYNNLLKPVYEDTVDGVVVLKIWENDKKFDIPKYGLHQEKQEDISVTNLDKETIIKLPQIEKLKRLEINYPQKDCDKEFINGTIYTSTDASSYMPDGDVINNFNSNEIAGYKADRVYFFAADKAQYIKIKYPDNYSCDILQNNYSVYVFPNL